MRKPIIFFYGSILFILFVFLQFNCSPDKPESEELTQEQMIDRGKYLVNFGGCHDCHSPKRGFDEKGPVLIKEKLLSGHPAEEAIAEIDTSSKWMQFNPSLTAWAGPWGVSFAANLTPDGPTGLGNWTEEIFMKAMRTGKHMGYGRPILPPMPWFSVATLTDQDTKALFAYLKSLKPVSNKVPDPIAPDMVAQAVNKK